MVKRTLIKREEDFKDGAEAVAILYGLPVTGKVVRRANYIYLYHNVEIPSDSRARGSVSSTPPIDDNYRYSYILAIDDDHFDPSYEQVWQIETVDCDSCIYPFCCKCQSPSTPQEFTMDEIAEKLGVEVSKLRIKK